ncbi:MAG: hypothetical protein IKY53_04775 [Lachnospiraceae bacterium]|nr:hypothetical protein [Lachnospiraceae bacterium]
MSEQGINNNMNSEKKQEDNANSKFTTEMIVWLVAAIASFVLALLCFGGGVLGIFVSLGLLMLPIVGIFGVLFTILSFAGGVLFLLLGVVATVFFIRSRNKSRDADKVAETVEKDTNVENTEVIETEEQKQ